MDRACSMHGKKRNVYRVLARKPEIKRPLGRLGCRLESNIKMVLRRNRMGWYGQD
jgi:hypothetical protein